MQTPILETERIFYAGTFAAGLFTGVYAMLHGSVRMKADPSAVKPPPSGFNAPVVSVALMCFGAIGYLLSKYYQTDPIYVILPALGAAVAGWIGMTLLMAKWALRGPIIDPHEELEELQGTIAEVTRDITLDTLGEISYTFRGQPLRVPARSIGGDSVPAGTEVVIEKIEEGVADVELWSVVEQRL